MPAVRRENQISIHLAFKVNLTRKEHAHIWKIKILPCIGYNLESKVYFISKFQIVWLYRRGSCDERTDPKLWSKPNRNNCEEAHVFLVEKWVGNYKARSCADEKKQHKIIKKEDATLPTQLLEGILATSLIEVCKEHNVVTVNLHGWVHHHWQEWKKKLLYWLSRSAQLFYRNLVKNKKVHQCI